MAKENDLNKTFVQMSGLVLLGGLIAAAYTGLGGLIVAGFTCYIMLVAVNAIKRGENVKKRLRK